MNTIEIAVFPSDLGWIATAWRGPRLHRVTFAHGNARAAVERCTPADAAADVVPANAHMQQLARRLQAFARGRRNDDFLDITLDMDDLTPFQQSVIERCRNIACGQTSTYGQLARAAGYAGAARAVGQVMAHNRWPLIIPCHRVVSASGLGGFSSRHGLQMKKRLLACESQQK